MFDAITLFKRRLQITDLTLYGVEGQIRVYLVLVTKAACIAFVAKIAMTRRKPLTLLQRCIRSKVSKDQHNRRYKMATYYIAQPLREDERIYNDNSIFYRFLKREQNHI